MLTTMEVLLPCLPPQFLRMLCHKLTVQETIIAGGPVIAPLIEEYGVSMLSESSDMHCDLAHEFRSVVSSDYFSFVFLCLCK